MDQQNAKYLGQSVDSVADSDHSQVKLTKFNPLSLDQHANRQFSAKNSSSSHLDSLSAIDLASTDNLLLVKSGHQLTSAAVDFLSGRPKSQELDFHDEQRARRDQFQIVWRKLAFEVDTKSYDKLITNAFHRLSSVLSCSSSGRSLDLEDPVKQQHQATGSTKRLIFENLNGYVKSGEISAIIGPSGAGKTSLLNALCGRTENYRGSIQLHGGSKRTKRLRLSIIPQKDYLIENLTVRESLLYASKILNPDKSTDHEANIVRVVKMLNLTTCFESSVSQISGGEYKRVSIAQELLSQPDILILDEPTSGLDSLNCKNLIRSLATLIQASRRGKINPIAIVMTIHQPDIDVFNMFDHVYCMARAGRVIYDGHPKDAMRVIKSYAQFDESNVPPELQQQQREAPDQEPAMFMTNPANLLIELASGALYGAKPIESLARLQRKQFEIRQLEQQQRRRFHAHYEPSIDFDKFERQLRRKSIDSNSSISNDTSGVSYSCSRLEDQRDNDDSNGSSMSSSSSSVSSKVPHLIRDKRLNSKRNSKRHLFFYHTNLLARRAFLATIRDPLISLASLMFHLLVPFVMFTVYSRKIGQVRGCPVVVRDLEMLSMASNQTLSIVEELQEELTVSLECGTMFFITIYSFSMCSIAVAALAFPMSMHVLLKEVRNGWYDLSSFVTAKTIASFPFEVLFPVVSIVMIYILLDMPSSYLEWRLWGIAAVVVLISMIGQTNGLIFGALCMDSVQTAIFLGLASTLPQTLVSGYTARIKQMPWWLGNLSWLSPYRYSNDMINMIRFGFDLCPCDDTTDEYLRTQEPQFKDIPAQMKPLFTYYLSNMLAPADDSETANSTLATVAATTPAANTTTLQLAATNVTNGVQQRIPGIYYDLNLNASERTSVLKRLDTSEIDIFKQLADQLTRSFAYGQPVKSCGSVRAQLLNTYETPQDDELAKLFAYMIGLLIGLKIILFVIVKFRIGSRV